MKHPAVSLRAELKDTLQLAWPIVLMQVGHMSMGMVDTVVAGRIGTNALAGLGMASNFFWTFTSVTIGCLYALDTFFSQALGAGDEKRVQRFLGQSIWTATALMIVSGVVVILAQAIYLGVVESSPASKAFDGYLDAVIWALPGMFFYVVLQRYWQARHVVAPFTLIIVVANVLNVFANLALGLGMWGFPRLEVTGLAIATVICRYAMLILAVAFTWWKMRPVKLTIPGFHRPTQKEIFGLGLPAAGHVGLEIGAFSIATVVVGGLGAVPLAAHHVCLMLAAFTFMFPMGFSSAAAVRVGTHIGASAPEKARMAGWICITLSVTVMSFFALGYVLIPGTMLGWFSQDPAVIELGVRILAVVAIFQIADGIQVCTAGALRGAGNTRAPMIANLIGHYPIGLALGLVLCYPLGFGAIGVWIGLAAGLISVAALLLRVWSHTSRDPQKLRPLAAHSHD